MKFNFRNIIALVFIFTIGTINAQETNIQSDSSAVGKILTLDEALRIGIQNSEELHSSNARVVSAESRVNEVTADRLPALNLNASYTRLSAVEPFTLNGGPLGSFRIPSSLQNNYFLQVSFRQPVFTGFRLNSSSRIAVYNYNDAQEEFAGDKQQLDLNITSAYWGLFNGITLKAVV